MLATEAGKRIKKAADNYDKERQALTAALQAGRPFDDFLIEPLAQAEAVHTLWSAVAEEIEDLTEHGRTPEAATQQALAAAHKRVIDELTQTGALRTTSLIKKALAEEHHDAMRAFLREVKHLLQV
ncbi:hypothetical protein [Streptomyces sp. NPDC002851]